MRWLKLTSWVYSSSRAVKIMTGIWEVLRISLSTSRPLLVGSIMSKMTRSKGSSSKACKASPPSKTGLTSYWLSFKNSQITWLIVVSSSTTRILCILRFFSFTYSNRRASIGSSLDAFTAGRSPNTTPIIQQKIKLTKTEKRDKIYG